MFIHFTCYTTTKRNGETINQSNLLNFLPYNNNFFFRAKKCTICWWISLHCLPRKYYILPTRKHKHYQITSLKNAVDTKPEKCYSLRLKVWLPWYRNCFEESCYLHTKYLRLKNIYELYMESWRCCSCTAVILLQHSMICIITLENATITKLKPTIFQEYFGSLVMSKTVNERLGLYTGVRR